jgi:hypothetical protein
MFRIVKRVLWWLRLWRDPMPPGWWRDPLLPKMAPLKPRPKSRSGAVAVAEPED